MAAKKKTTKKTKKKASNTEQSSKPEYKIIALDLIDDPTAPMRSDLSEESVADLVMSIKQVGVIEPIVVKPNNARYEVIA